MKLSKYSKMIFTLMASICLLVIIIITSVQRDSLATKYVKYQGVSYRLEIRRMDNDLLICIDKNNYALLLRQGSLRMLFEPIDESISQNNITIEFNEPEGLAIFVAGNKYCVFDLAGMVMLETGRRGTETEQKTGQIQLLNDGTPKP